MSHAAIIASPTLESVLKLGIEGALSWEMEPFDENGQWFRDGSRWDWYRIGGRYTGLISGYDPRRDPANYETCDMCGGTGDRAAFRGESKENQHPSGCNGCLGKKISLKFAFNAHSGDHIQVKGLDLKKVLASDIANVTLDFEEAMKSGDMHDREFRWGIRPEDTLQSYIDRVVGKNPIRASAFLRNRHWHECERLGLFGASTYTECERKDMDEPKGDPANWFGKCLHKDEATGAQIVCWNEPHEIWNEFYYQRFVQPLGPEEHLLVVDYHV